MAFARKAAPERESDLPRSIDPRELASLFDHEPPHYLRRVPGRETFRWTPSGGPAVIVKRFARGSAGEAWRERLRGTGPRSPARREAEALRELAALGLRVPRPVDLLERGARSLLVLEEVPHAETLRELRELDPARRRALGEELLALVARLHGCGWYHRDLYLQHLVLDQRRPGPGGLTLLDCGRARRSRRPRRRWLEKDLAALALWLPQDLPRATALRFLAGYLDRLGITARAARRRWARAVERRRRRMARHRPRHGEEPR